MGNRTAYRVVDIADHFIQATLFSERRPSNSGSDQKLTALKLIPFGPAAV